MDWVKSNAEKILQDISLLANDTPLLTNDHNNRIFGEHPVFMESGAKAMGCTFNTIEGPVFIGKDALLMEGGLIRGPVSIGRNAVVKMGAQLYSGTTIGKNATAGGEIKNSILGDFSNKAHHGYLGDSIIGMWCNLGAGTSNSNVKNNAGVIKMWSEEAKDLIPVGQKAGIIMGDFSKTAINTSINSGTTIGCCTSIHMLPQGEKNIPGFIWGGYEKYAFEKLKRDIKQWMDWKNVIPDPSLWNTLWHLYNTHTGPYDENHDSYN
jgi:UDP-N-acetylglucosamine diphosphorylase/glucosamine-1-phosphate N-acetyltransferase